MTASELLYQLHFVDVLLLLAVVAGQDAVGNVEVGTHRLVVGDALRVVALHDAPYFAGCLNGFLLYHFVVADDVENDFGRYDGEAGNLVVGKELVADFDNALVPNLLRRVVETDGNRGLQVEESQQRSYLIGLVGGYVVDDGAVLDSGN